MNGRLAISAARRRPHGIVVAVLWLLISPLCEALCQHETDTLLHDTPAPMVAEATDCHGEAAEQPDAGSRCCDGHVPTHSGSDRVDPPPPMVTAFHQALLPQTAPPVRAPARADPAAHGQGPPLRLLTLRFIE